MAEKKIWGQFQGKEDTNDVLFEKAKALTMPLVIVVKENTNELLLEISKHLHIKFKDDFGGELVIEMMFFFLHLIDRVAFKFLGQDKRDAFVNALFEEALNFYSRPHPDKVAPDGFSGMFVTMFNERQKEYWKYKKWFPEENERTKDTLFWEFGKKFAHICGLKMNVIPILLIQFYTFNSIKAFKLPELFGSVDNKI